MAASSPIKNLEILPPTSDSYMWADYIELLCLTSTDGRISRADAVDFIRQRAEDLKEGKAVEGDEAEEHDIEEEMDIEDEEGDDVTEVSPEPEEGDDKWERRADDWFNHLAYRVGAFGEFYPFQITPGGAVLKLRKQKASLTVKYKLYLFLLFASNLRYFGRKEISSIASIFEVASFYALETHLPAGANLHMFGKHPLNTGRYTGLLWNKLHDLTKDLKEEVVCLKENFKPTDTGDAGLDLVAWSPLEDTTNLMPGFLLVFGQCACTPEWVTKQMETHYDTWSNYMSFTAYPFRFTFIPFCFRKANGNWYEKTKIRKTAVIDRLRLINLLRGKEKKLKPHIAPHIDEVVSGAVQVW
jgi:hypothetical protein